MTIQDQIDHHRLVDSDTSSESVLGRRKERVLVACTRCKRRKRKCDGNNPCLNCTRAGSECVFDRKDSQKALLEDLGDEIYKERAKNAVLEAEIAHLKAIVHDKCTQYVNIKQSLDHHKQLVAQYENGAAIAGRQMSKRFPNALGLATDSLNVKDSFMSTLSKLLYRQCGEADEYIGTFAMISIVKAIRKNLMGGTVVTDPSPTIIEPDLQDNMYIPPQIEKGFLQRFFSMSHNRHYFLDEHNFYERLALPDAEKSQWDLFATNIALGIGCRLNELLHVTTYTSPDIYFKRALKHLTDAQLNTIQQIQACLLIALFIGRSYHLSFYVTSWELTGLALRKLVQYGYHRKQPVTYERTLEYEFHKRLFWSAYSYDRLLSLSLGRPGTINECFIDIPFPLSIESRIAPTEENIYHTYQQQRLQETNPDTEQKISVFTSLINTCKVRQIESRIHLLFYTVNQCVPNADNFGSIVRDIELWFSSLPSREKFEKALNGRESYDYLELLYFRGKLILFLPKIITSSSEPELATILDEACRSAGGICNSYKNLYRDSVLEFSILALHTIFLAGVTMVYYLRNKGYPTFMNMQTSIRACSSLLFVFSERWPEARSYRDLFDNLLEHAENYREGGSAARRLNSATPRTPIVLDQGNNVSDLTTQAGYPIVNDDGASVNFSLEEDFWSQILLDIQGGHQD